MVLDPAVAEPGRLGGARARDEGLARRLGTHAAQRDTEPHVISSVAAARERCASRVAALHHGDVPRP